MFNCGFIVVDEQFLSISDFLRYLITLFLMRIPRHETDRLAYPLDSDSTASSKRLGGVSVYVEKAERVATYSNPETSLNVTTHLYAIVDADLYTM